MAQSVIVYRYDASPHSRKLNYALLLKNIPQKWVNVPMVPPRPDVELLGVAYRRIPILAIGSDLYFDTSLATSALERRFPPQAQAGSAYGSIYPPRKDGSRSDAALIKIFTRSWVDGELYRAVVPLVLWSTIPEALRVDRESFMGPIDPAQLAAARPANISAFASQVARMEDQFADGREWLFDTQMPSFADTSAYGACVWAERLLGPESESVFTDAIFPSTAKWMARISQHLSALETAQPATLITGEEAAVEIAVAPCEPETVVGFNELEARRLGFERGDQVSVTMDGLGNSPTTGRLVALNREEIVIETKGVYRCHFPRIGFTARLA
ncbi:hypothetical protein HMN09_01062400 [Mycena chlorophos]|uniref:GST N-terminal domain-containing protein n=1 Tax=Mycena chlorophos TaxID=658473 RepID=A0A8H6SBV8_MYCCL|nr:hypothetical protein HMN09_01062400 [Mycena chlorophos]